MKIFSESIEFLVLVIHGLRIGGIDYLWTKTSMFSLNYPNLDLKHWIRYFRIEKISPFKKTGETCTYTSLYYLSACLSHFLFVQDCLSKNLNEAKKKWDVSQFVLKIKKAEPVIKELEQWFTTGGRFHQHFTHSFFSRRSQKRKN